MFILSHMLIPGPNTVAREWAMMLAGWSQVPLLAGDWQPWQPSPVPDFTGEWFPCGGGEVQGRQKLAYLRAAFTPLAWVSASQAQPVFLLLHVRSFFP